MATGSSSRSATTTEHVDRNMISLEESELSPVEIKNIKDIKDDLFNAVMECDWDDVIANYKENKNICQTAMITRSKNTALHVAISDHRVEVAEQLLENVDSEKIKEMVNERGNNPLHFAAALGMEGLCKIMVNRAEELIDERNIDGETPLFLAALHGKKNAFYALHLPCSVEKTLHYTRNIPHCKRNTDGNTILHVAILGEHFDLALQIVNWYPELCNRRNISGQLPLQLLAKNPSAFRSGCHYGPLDDFIYRCLLVEQPKFETPSSHLEIKKKHPIRFPHPGNYKTLHDLLILLSRACGSESEGVGPMIKKLPSRRVVLRSIHVQTPLDHFLWSYSSPTLCGLRGLRIEKWWKSLKEEENQSPAPIRDGVNQPLRSNECPHTHIEDIKFLEEHENSEQGAKKHKQRRRTKKNNSLSTPAHQSIPVGDQTKQGHKEEKKAKRSGSTLVQPPFPANYYTILKFLEFLMELFLFVCGLGWFKVRRMREKKQKHIWTLHVMKKLVSSAKEDWEYDDAGSKPSNIKDLREKEFEKVNSKLPKKEPTIQDELPKSANDTQQPDKGTASGNENNSGNGILAALTRTEQFVHVEMGKTRPDVYDLKMSVPKLHKEGNEKSPILVAAKMGVMEMVDEILRKFPVAIDDKNLEKKNAVMLAVEYRQPKVYKLLKKKYAEKESIFQIVDKEGNSALHLAASLSKDRLWLIPGAALQMQWEMKWFKFIKESMPPHFFTHLNTKGETPNEVFTETHRDMVKNGGKWLTDTSQSCSVVAALIATVAFASATTVPGGMKEDVGRPIFEGKPAFNIFAITSLIALCFSVTALTMFLSILTSRYQAGDFLYNLPTKLLVGLTSLFISIASMLVSFCAGHFFVLQDEIKLAALPVYAITCLPVSLFAVSQLPLYLDLIRSSAAGVPKRSHEVTSL